MVVIVVVSPKGVDIGSEGGAVEGTTGALGRLVKVTGSDEMTAVISGVLVGRLMNWEGGVMLFSHSVVPLMTEK